MKFDCLASLDRKELIRLADLLVADPASPPMTELALQNYLTREQASQVTGILEELQRNRMTPDQIALLLRAFAAGTEVSNHASPTVDVVVTGPDATTRTRDTGVVVRQLFRKARQKILAVGFAVHQGKSVFKTLGERLDHDHSIKATLCLNIERRHGSTSLDQNIIRRFANEFARDVWPGMRLPKVYYDPRSLASSGPTASSMHAKCIVIDGQEAFVTSANFTEAAQERNIELGLLVNSPVIARQIDDHFTSLIRNNSLVRLALPDQLG
ncbi:MAG: DISARM system phospholipase D-like protein DrmC [Bacteroidota bacterium]|nr:DISARM system phospholipase D-like protein DrmC [Bacteroidota bacterium]MDE2645414.1 DISARM system phospholipase D-like protein DrmC [Bacteroidota bacterium]MXW32378.1 phospholipase [Rhodothermaceae bacterium]MYE63756.1 phospholipase [Rhodothermaceae bacterium]MYJ21610.1 phospholipase [Rhodothermaceae bacterium]